MFPAHLLRAGLSHREQSVLLCLLSYRNGNGQAWPSRSKIAADTCIDVSHIRRAIKSLAQRGVITIDVQPGVRTVYTFPCLDAQPADTPEPVPAPAPVVAKNARAAVPVPAPVPEPEPVQEPVPVATPEPTPAPVQPTDDNPSQVAVPEQRPAIAPEPAPTPAQPPAPEQPRAQQPVQVPAPVVAPVATQEPKPTPAPVVAPAPMPALEPAPPAPKRAIVSARVARLPDVDEAVRREVDARPVIKSSGNKEVPPELMARAKRLQKLCAENTARSLEQKAAAQRSEDGVTAAEQAAAAAAAVKPEKHAEPGTTGDVITGNGQNVEQQAAQNVAAPTPAPAVPVPAETVAQPAPEPVAPAPVVVPVPAPVPVVAQESPEPAPQQALPVICEPQAPAATPQQGELLPVPAKQGKQRIKSVAVQGELLPIEKKGRATRLPEDWQLPRKWGEWAMQEYGFTEDEVRFHAKQFYRHWVSSSGSNAFKVSWFLTWQKWMGVEYQKKQRYNNRPQQKSKTMQAIEYFANKYNGDFEIPF